MKYTPVVETAVTYASFIDRMSKRKIDEQRFALHGINSALRNMTPPQLYVMDVWPRFASLREFAKPVHA